jgi:hypothetical protein
VVVDQSPQSEQDPEPHISPERRWWRHRKTRVIAAVVFVVGLVAFVANLGTIRDTLAPDKQERVVQDGGDPQGCKDDARQAHGQDVVTPDGQRTVGTLQVMHSVKCNGMWGRLKVADGQPEDGYDVTITIVRSGDNRPDTYHNKIKTTAFYTGLLQIKGTCFTVKATIGTPQGVVNAETPCTSPK